MEHDAMTALLCVSLSVVREKERLLHQLLVFPVLRLHPVPCTTILLIASVLHSVPGSRSCVSGPLRAGMESDRQLIESG